MSHTEFDVAEEASDHGVCEHRAMVSVVIPSP
jgi:hypothetical protein